MAKNSGITDVTVISEDVGHKAVCSVTVKPVYITEIVVPSDNLTLTVGKPFQIDATVYLPDAIDKTLTYTAVDSNLITVTSEGVIIANGKVLNSEIIISAVGGVTKKIFVSTD